MKTAISEPWQSEIKLQIKFHNDWKKIPFKRLKLDDSKIPVRHLKSIWKVYWMSEMDSHFETEKLRFGLNSDFQNRSLKPINKALKTANFRLKVWNRLPMAFQKMIQRQTLSKKFVKTIAFRNWKIDFYPKAVTFKNGR